jgi:DNA-directed RNA polymerase specialized sigma24 family protein
VRTIASNVLRRALHVAPRHSMQALPEGLQEPADARLGPHLRLVQGEEHRALRQAWVLFLQHYAEAYRSLSPRDRRALDLVEVEGLSYAETSERLGVGPSNMKMIMLRSRRRLQNRMRKAMFDGALPAAAPAPSRSTLGRPVAVAAARAVG